VADDASRDGTLQAMARLRRLGGRVLAISTLDLAGAADSAVRTPATGHPATDALVFALAWYRAIEAATRRRGLDPDRPANLRKVTETV
jgi:glucosamine--fructose-6-phosphate aminotransferase (isomerizing)